MKADDDAVRGRGQREGGSLAQIYGAHGFAANFHKRGGDEQGQPWAAAQVPLQPQSYPHTLRTLYPCSTHIQPAPEQRIPLAPPPPPSPSAAATAAACRGGGWLRGGGGGAVVGGGRRRRRRRQQDDGKTENQAFFLFKIQAEFLFNITTKVCLKYKTEVCI